jgi:hypothetical protein
MPIAVLDYFRLKPEFLPAHLKSAAVYVRPNELSAHVTDVAQWELVGRTFHPNRLQAADVERQGYCFRYLPAGLKFPPSWHDHPSSRAARG